MSTLTPSTTLSDEPICSHTYSMDHLMISQYWGKSAFTKYCVRLLRRANYPRQTGGDCVEPISRAQHPRQFGGVLVRRDACVLGLVPAHCPRIQEIQRGRDRVRSAWPLSHYQRFSRER